MNITYESNQMPRPKSKERILEELTSQLKMINTTIDKLNIQRVEVLHKIHKLKTEIKLELAKKGNTNVNQ